MLLTDELLSSLSSFLQYLLHILRRCQAAASSHWILLLYVVLWGAALSPRVFKLELFYLWIFMEKYRIFLSILAN